MRDLDPGEQIEQCPVCDADIITSAGRILSDQESWRHVVDHGIVNFGFCRICNKPYDKAFMQHVESHSEAEIALFMLGNVR